MTTDDMSIPRSSLRSLLPDLSSSLHSFQSSHSKFRIIHTINPRPNTPPPSPKTLLILDSSFNPPSKAHLSLATSALHATATTSSTQQAPYRLLLLFSTQNADKAPSAASFDQRLALMTIFAEDLLRTLSSTSSSSHPLTTPAIDIGLTTAPYYTDKSAAISSTAEGKDAYPSTPTHMHILGFDTITRIFAAKYYPDFDPPFSALNAYFDVGHRLRVTLRPSEEFGSVETQRAFIKGIGEGKMQKEGAKREWGKLIEIVEAGEGMGVSSTRVRKAAKREDWKEVEELCTEGVAAAVREGKVYEGDDRGSKMA